MATGSQFSIDVVAALNATNIPKELKDLNTRLTKDTTNVIKIPIGIDAQSGKKIFQELIKDVRIYKDELNNTFKRVTLTNPFSGMVKSDKIKQVTDAIKTLTTETHKWTNTKGEINTWTTSIDSLGQTIQTRTKEYVNDVGEAITETSNWGRNAQGQWAQLGDTIRNSTDIIKDTTTTTTSSFGQITDTINGVTNSYNGLITTTEQVSSNGEYLKTVVSQYTNELGQVVIKTEQFDKANRQVSTTERQISQDIQNTSKNVKLFGMSFSDAFNRLSQFYLASLPIRAVQKAITETISTIKEFDSALVEFRKVSDLAGESLDNYVKKLAQVGELTGSTVQAMVEAATEFKKSGFSEEDSAKLASVAEMYRNIADEEVSAADSASFIISQMKAFNIEAENSQHIIDAVNEVANNFALSSADLANNLGKVSATLAVNGVSFEQQIGMLTAITEVTRNASTSARGLSMISSRLVQVLDENSTTGQKLVKIYNDLGIELKDENGQMRGAYDILRDLAEQWNTLSGDQQKYIALTSAGARQTQNFVALMKNFDQAIKATDTALNSQGSALKENEKVMESIDKKLQVLKSQFQQLVIDSGIQDFTKLLLDLSISLLKFANTDLGKVTISIVAFEAVLVLVNNTIIKTGKTLAAQILVNQGYSVSMAEMAVSTMGFGAALDIIKTKLIQTTTAFLASPFGQAAIIIASMVAVGLAIDKYNKRLDDSVEKMKELSDQTKETENELNDLKDQLHEVREQLKKVNEEKLNISDKEQLAQLERHSRELENQELILKRQLDLVQQRYEIERKETEEQAKKAYNTTERSSYKKEELDPSAYGSGAMADYAQVLPIEELKLATEALKEYTEERNRLIRLSEAEERTKEKYTELLRIEKEQHGENTDSYREYQAEIEKATNNYEKYQSQLENANAEVEKAQKVGQKNAEILNEIDNELQSTDATTQQYKEDIAEANDAYLEASNGALETADNIHGLGEALQETDETTEEDIDEFEELNKAIDDLAESLGITATELNVLKTRFDALTLAKFLGELAQIKQKISDTNTTIDNLQSALETASNALAEYNQNGYLTIDTFQELMGVSAQYLAALVNENGQLEINQQSLQNLVDELKMAKIEELAEAAAMEIAALQHKNAQITADSASESIEKAGNAFKNAGDKASKASAGIALFNAELAKATGGTLGDYSSSEKVIIEKYRKLAKEISTLEVNTTRAGNSASTAGRKGASAAKEAKDATKDLNQELEKLKSQYEKVISYLSSEYDRKISELEKAKDKELKAIDEEIKALEKEKDEEVKAIEKEIEEIKEKEKTLTENVKKEIELLKKHKEELVKNLEKEIEALEKEKKEFKKATDEKIKALEKEKKAYSEKMDLEIKGVEKEKDAFKKSIDAEIDVLEEKKKTFVKGIEKEADALKKEQKAIIKSIEEESKALKQQKEERQKYWEERIDALKKENDERKDAIELQEKLDAIERAKNTKVKIYKEGEGFVYDVDQTKVQQAQKELDEYLSEKAYEEELERLNKLKDAELQNFTDRLDELNTYKEQVNEYYTQQLDDLDAYKEQEVAKLDAELEELKAYKEYRLEQYEEELEKLKQEKEDRLDQYDIELEELKAYEEHKLDEYEKEIENLKDQEEKIKEAYEEKIEDLERHLEEKREQYEKEIEDLEKRKDEIEKNYEDEIENLQKHREAVEEEYNAEIEKYQEYKREFEEMVNAYEREQTRLLAEQLTGLSLENDNWMTRLENLSNFVNAYNALLAQLNTDVPSTPSTPTETPTPSPTPTPTPAPTPYTPPYVTPTPTPYTPPYKTHANGVSSVKDDELAIVGENPNKEIVLGSKLNNGQLMSLNKGTGVVNANATNTLAGMLNQVGSFGASGFGSGNGVLNNNINNDSLVVNGVTIQGSNISDPQTFVNGLLNLKSEALQRAYRRS